MDKLLKLLKHCKEVESEENDLVQELERSVNDGLMKAFCIHLHYEKQMMLSLF